MVCSGYSCCVAKRLELGGVKCESGLQEGPGWEILPVGSLMRLGLQSSEGLTGLDVQDGPLTWLAVKTGCWLGVQLALLIRNIYTWPHSMMA